MADPVDERISDLYGRPPEEFVPARTALAKELRAAGDREAAEEVAGLRRPTLVAWALNQLRRVDPEGLDEFVTAAGTLRAAQERALGGDRTADLRSAMAERREAGARLVRAASDALRELSRDPDPHMAQMASTLDAAAADPDTLDRLRAGRLSTDVESTGFEFGGLPAVGRAPATKAAPAPKRPSKAAPRDASDRRAERREDAAQRKAEAAEAKREAAEAAKAVRAAERNADSAAAAVAAAQRRVDDLGERLRVARLALGDSERAARSAQKELDAARRRHPSGGGA